MRSLNFLEVAVGLNCIVGSVRCAVVPFAQPVITPKPEVEEAWMKRQAPDAISLAEILLTAIPQSLRQIAATNAPAVSSILWQEFLDNNRPQWFLDLPYDIQSYLIKQFGPETAWLPASSTPAPTGTQVTPTDSIWTWPTITGSPSIAPSIASTPRSSRSSGIATIPSSLSTTLKSSLSSSLHSSSIPTTTIHGSSESASRSPSASLVSASKDPASPPASGNGLNQNQKVGLGVGIPLGIFGAAALLLGCCFLLRRKRQRRPRGTESPSSPGFIPRFAFQDKSTDNFEHRRPLNRASNHSVQNPGSHDWEDDGIDPFEPYNNDTAYHGHALAPAGPNQSTGAPSAPMAMHDSAPIMAPVVYHTHSSNRARGKRTSYSSLHSVAEVSEPDEFVESPVLGRHTTPLQRKRRPSMPMVLEMPSNATSRHSSVKRKPVPTSPQASNPAADLASQSLLRPAMAHPDHSGSSSSGLALSTNSSTYANQDQTSSSPISPISDHNLPFSRSSQALSHASSNPFGSDYAYVEDYGPEYQSGYVDVSDGLYGGHTSLDRYANVTSPASKSSKTEWPLRNLSLGRKREKSPLWDRVYESP